jgi:hypothetical protein
VGYPFLFFCLCFAFLGQMSAREIIVDDVTQVNCGKLQTIAERNELSQGWLVGCDIVYRGYGHGCAMFIVSAISGDSVRRASACSQGIRFLGDLVCNIHSINKIPPTQTKEK